jgi:hypothetical protein
MSATTTIKLKDEVVTNIRSNLRLKNRLALELDKSQITIQRYLDKNSDLLTTATALKIISEETGLEQSNLLSA